MGPAAQDAAVERAATSAQGASSSVTTATAAVVTTTTAGAASETQAALLPAQPQQAQAAAAAQTALLHQQHQGGPWQQQDRQGGLPPALPQEVGLPTGHMWVLLTRRTLAELLLTRQQLQQLVPLELLLRELRSQRGVPHASPLVGAVVRLKAGGQHLLARVAAVSLAAGPASRGRGIELRLHVQPQPPQLRRDYVLPAELSSTDSLAEGAPYEQAGRRERAEFEARLGCLRWDLHETAMAACRLKVASHWAANLATWMHEHGAERLEQHLAAPPLLQDMLSFLAEPAAPVVPATPAVPVAPSAPTPVLQQPASSAAAPVVVEQLQHAGSLGAHDHHHQPPPPQQPQQQPQQQQQQQQQQPPPQPAWHQPAAQPSQQAPVPTPQQQPLTATTAGLQHTPAAALQQHAAAPVPAQQQPWASGIPCAQQDRQHTSSIADGAPAKQGPKPRLTLRMSCIDLFARALAEVDSRVYLNQLAPRMQALSATKWTAPRAAGMRFTEFVRLAMGHSKITQQYKLRLYRREGEEHWLLAVKRKRQQEPPQRLEHLEHPQQQQQQKVPPRPQQAPPPREQSLRPAQQLLHQPKQAQSQLQEQRPQQQPETLKRQADGLLESEQQAQRSRLGAPCAAQHSVASVGQGCATSGGAAKEPGWFWHSACVPCRDPAQPVFSLLSPTGQPGSAGCEPAQPPPGKQPAGVPQDGCTC